MGDVVSLGAYRERRDPRRAVRRLDMAVGRLDPLVRDRGGRLPVSAERELASIVNALSLGRASEAAERAERLADLLEHPAAL